MECKGLARHPLLSTGPCQSQRNASFQCEPSEHFLFEKLHCTGYKKRVPPCSSHASGICRLVVRPGKKMVDGRWQENGSARQENTAPKFNPDQCKKVSPSQARKSSKQAKKTIKKRTGRQRSKELSAAGVAKKPNGCITSILRRFANMTLILESKATRRNIQAGSKPN